jgi:hypothetical protein
MFRKSLVIFVTCISLALPVSLAAAEVDTAPHRTESHSQSDPPSQILAKFHILSASSSACIANAVQEARVDALAVKSAGLHEMAEVIKRWAARGISMLRTRILEVRSLVC